MLKQKHVTFLEQLEELDTGKAQPLYHTFPVINIFREDGEDKKETILRKHEDRKLLEGKNGAVRGFCEALEAETVARAKVEGASFDQGEAAFILEPDCDGLTLKSHASLGWVSLKATLGTTSRYGMGATAPSLTQIAVSARTVEDTAKVLEAVAAVDKKDPMSRDCYIYDYTEGLQEDLTGMVVAVPEQFYELQISEPQRAVFSNVCAILEKKGATIETVELPWEEYIMPVHECITACEKTMTLSGMDGLTDMDQYDLELGDFLLSRENYEMYEKTLKVRSLIKDSYDLLLRDHSILLVPYTWGDDIYFAGANLSGLPTLAMPIMPGGDKTRKISVGQECSGETGENCECSTKTPNAEIKNVREMQCSTGIQMVAGANQEKMLIKAAYAISSAYRR